MCFFFVVNPKNDIRFFEKLAINILFKIKVNFPCAVLKKLRL